jgi:hypothetical protein
MTTSMHANCAPEAMGMALAALPRVRANGSYTTVAFWSPIALGTTDQKHRSPRRIQASP